MRIDLNSFRGEAPRLTPRALPPNGAQIATNARLQSGDLEAWRQFAVEETLADIAAPETIYLLNDQWLSWSADVDVARGAIPGDDTFRIYLTGPDLYDQPRFTNYALATTGDRPYPVTTRPLGVPNPDTPAALAAGVSTAPTSNTTEITDSGDQLDSAWTTSPPITSGFTTSQVVQDSLVGNGPPSYRLDADENSAAPAYLYRDFGLADSQVVRFSVDFRISSGGGADKRRMQVNLMASSTGAGIFASWTEAGVLAVGISQEWSSFNLSPLDGVAIGAPTLDIWHTLQVQVVRNADGSRTVTAGVYNGSAQIGGSVVVTNAFINNGGYFGGVLHVGEDAATAWRTRYDNWFAIGTSPTDPLLQTATSYVYTFVNDLGEESGPSPASVTILKDDGTAITVTTPVAVQSGFSVDYNVTTKRIYRAVTGNTGTAFRFVAEIPLAQADYVDELTDSELGDVLETEDWELPPDDLRGILALPNGIMVGFRRNQLCFSAQNRPHAWPIKYRLNTDTDIVAIGNIDNTVVIGTEAFPYVATGNDPSAYSMSKLEVPQACVAKRSLAYLTSIGIVFASPDGLIAISGNGRVSNLSETVFTRRQWQDLDPTTIRAIAHDDVYFFFPDGVEGRALDMKPNGFGLIRLSFHGRALFSDPLTDKLYMTLDEYDEPSSPYLPLPSNAPVIDGSNNLDTGFTEDFEIGTITPTYTLISGSLARFSLVATSSGEGLRIDDATAGTQDIIQRDTPPRLAQRASAVFTVNNINSDDSGFVNWQLDGVAQIGLLPVREAAFDALRRVHAIIDSEEIALTAAQITVGVEYRVDIELSATPGETVGTVTRTSDNVVVGTGTFSLAHAPRVINGLRFTRDNNGTTCEIVYDDVSVAADIPGTVIFEFDSPDAYGDLTYLYRGKLNRLAAPCAFVYCQVKADDYTNVVLNLYGDGDLIFQTVLTDKEPFTLPMLDQYETFEIEIIGTSRIESVRTAEMIEELMQEG